MFLFQLVCKIDPAGKLAADKQFAKVGGAYVEVWIHFKDFEGAKVLAQHYAQQAGWLIEKQWGIMKIQRSQLSKKDKPFYEEAVKYGYSTVARMWPKDAPDADRDYETGDDKESYEKDYREIKRS